VTVGVDVRVGVGVGVCVSVGVGVCVTVGVEVFVAEGVGVAVVVLGDAVVVLGDAVVAVGEAVVFEGDAEDVVVGEVDVVGDLVAEGDALVVLGDGVGSVWLSTVKVARRTEVRPRDHFRTAVIVCCPSASVAVSKGRAEPSLAVPAKSNGGRNSVRTSVRVCQESPR
jgi:hypothetical protein